MNPSKYLFGSLNFCIEQLHQHKIIAYPTEAVFGLGCDPDNKSAVMELRILKKRPIKKGLILISDQYLRLRPYIDEQKLTILQREEMLSRWPGPITYVVPASATTPYWLIGFSKSIAVRVSNHDSVRELCCGFGKPLVSTSANLCGKPPCRNLVEVEQQFGLNFPVLHAKIGGRLNPSEIRDAISGKIIRQG
ncbi:Sua5/YciO/YrdC/YwlC family protein [Candidatus Pantoea carbekii]|uniref:Threonylcarbamoyl-AMP synthase n=1 Tax=Candidatus Pantoea carbekii TaxID=1235990 RepID=U3U941_9GAMM|nr:Sua5/YciO/YrdC/YwlC family protein [Candidatus Pantoea carbekii]AKC32501.1 protein yrdC YrdC [Candidatus Pantoea carbekii]BAO00228.1 YrdC protein [Candidatus Pantoea carbekii]